MPGSSASACGAGGASCSTCGAGEACSGGTCESTGCSVRDVGGFDAEDTCAGENICNCGPTSAFCEGTGTCVPAFGRIYRVGIFRVQLPERRPDGSCWDSPGCGAPDPYVRLTVDGTVIGRTPTVSDQFEAVWDPPVILDASILAGTRLRLDVFDEDIGTDDGAFACAHEPISAARLRSRNVGCSGTLGEMRAVIVFVP